ncbi:MAG TPA: ROK family transcriptional regulator [Microbacterium sp.]|uniref:ROK family transcriptional regulator n=1 Tax=Microbacterium sp. TaxID=51671 RepID=UPI002B493FAB|nr:ROK family transcriptional regulator [Microbacterium sp.]HKT55472.1 ROK family transcriptional regulator [Microbacterium sp.]
MDAALGARESNLGRVLQILHRDGPQSRATLTERTGLNRSTTASLVGELAELGLVDEGAPEPTNRVGRPSPMASVSPRVVALAANTEVDAITVAAVRLDQSVALRERIPVDGPLSPEAAADVIGDRVRTWRAEALAGHRIAGIGVAVPGLVRVADGLVRQAPHLRWRDAPLRDLVAGRTGLPAHVDNDASLGAVAEHLYGAARGIDHVVYLDGASGIGGGLIVHGMPVGGAAGYAGEFGQNRPGIGDPADRRCPGGVLEDEVNRDRVLTMLGLAGIDEPELAAAIAASGDPAVPAELARQSRILAAALANAVNVLNPSTVVLGGYLATLCALAPGDLVTQVQAQCMPASGEGLQIRPAQLGVDRQLVGAAEVAFRDLLRLPLQAIAAQSR